MSTSSASRQALNIPLIVAVVLQSIHDEIVDWEMERGVLFNCMLVNHLWSQEARKLLWAAAGADQIKSIATIPLQRQQKYANYIRTLFYDEQVHDSLRIEHLSFPRLTGLFLDTSQHVERPCSILSLEQFIQPRLTDLSIIIHKDARHLISMEFLQCLQHKAKDLRALVVRLLDDVPEPDLVGKLISDRLASLLHTFQSLEAIDWQWNNMIRRASFEALGEISSLQAMSLVEIHDNWPDNLCEMAFQNLICLRCMISGQGMRKLCPYIGGIQHLLLREADGLVGLVTILAHAQFRHLVTLNLHLDETREISTNDLMLIAKSSPQLERLVIDVPDEDDDGFGLVHVADLSDQTVLNLATTLPLLKCLHLFCSSDQPELSETSLVSLGSHCPLLGECRLWAQIDWEQLMKDAPLSGWPYLETLTIDNDLEEEGQYHDVDELVKTIATKMPEVVDLSFGDVMKELGRAWSKYADSELVS